MAPDPDNDAARAELRRAIMNALCKVLNANGLPPMTAMSFAAAAIGSIYKQVADQHRFGEPCVCGWQPNPLADVEALQAALSGAAAPAPLPDLRTVQVAGRA